MIIKHEKLYENILIHDIFYKTLIDPKPLLIRFDQIDEYIIYDRISYLFRHCLTQKKYGAIYSRIRYLISQKSGISNIFWHYFPNIKVDSYDPLPIEKRLD